jgi:hypothetical protein
MRLSPITANRLRQARSLVSRVRLALSSPSNAARGCHDAGPGGNYDPAARGRLLTEGRVVRSGPSQPFAPTGGRSVPI